MLFAIGDDGREFPMSEKRIDKVFQRCSGAGLGCAAESFSLKLLFFEIYFS